MPRVVCWLQNHNKLSFVTSRLGDSFILFALCHAIFSVLKDPVP